MSKKTQTVARCSCGQAIAFADAKSGATNRPANVLITLFRYFHNGPEHKVGEYHEPLRKHQ